MTNYLKVKNIEEHAIMQLRNMERTGELVPYFSNNELDICTLSKSPEEIILHDYLNADLAYSEKLDMINELGTMYVLSLIQQANEAQPELNFEVCENIGDVESVFNTVLRYNAYYVCKDIQDAINERLTEVEGYKHDHMTEGQKSIANYLNLQKILKYL